MAIVHCNRELDPACRASLLRSPRLKRPSNRRHPLRCMSLELAPNGHRAPWRWMSVCGARAAVEHGRWRFGRRARCPLHAHSSVQFNV